MHKGKHITCEAIIISIMQDTACSLGDAHKRGPATSEEGVATVTEGGVNMSGGGVAAVVARPTPERAGGGGGSAAERGSAAEHAGQEVEEGKPAGGLRLRGCSGSLTSDSSAVVKHGTLGCLCASCRASPLCVVSYGM